MATRDPSHRLSIGPRLTHAWTAWVVLACTLAFTGVAAWYVASSTLAWDTLRFERQVDISARLVARRIATYVTLLRSTAAFVAAAEGELDARGFADFVRALDLSHDYPGIQGIGWSLRLAADATPPPDSKMTHIWPLSAGPERHAIVYLEPQDRRNQAALGYDMSTEPTRRAAMERARESGEATASGPVTLVQEVDDRQQASFLIYVPVYTGRDVPATLEARQHLLRGFAYAPFRVDDLLEGLFGATGTPPALTLKVFDLAAADGTVLLFNSHPEGGHGRFRSTRVLDVAGRPWLVDLSSQRGFDRSRVPLVLGILTPGVGLSFALFALMLAQGRARGAAEFAASELAVSEERFRALIDQSPLSTQIFAPDGRMLRTNPAWERMWGLTAAELGEYNVLHDPNLEEHGVLEVIREAFAGAARLVPMIPYSPPAGEHAGQPRWVRAFIYPVLEPSGRIREVVLVHEDVTERVRAEEALQRAQRMESIGVLAGGVAHDFNNLLTGIVGYAELALHELPPDAEVAGHLRQVLSAGERAAELTRQLLAYAGKGRFIVHQVDVGDTVRGMKELVHASISRTIEIELDLDDGPLPVMADGSQVQQLVMNLVINAAEAIGDRHGHIRVAAHRRELSRAALREGYPNEELSPGAYVEVIVEDDGGGMDAAVRARIFEPFYTTKFMGRGLGLAAALGIIRGHAGAISVDSTPGVGTIFRLILPLAAGPSIEAPATESTDLRGDERVLVVDDERVIREAARAVLEGAGFQVELAHDGDEALARLSAAPAHFDLVVLDLTMPGLGGAEVLAQLRAANAPVRVLLTSGYGEAEAVGRIDRDAIAGFLPKPWTAARLLAAVRSALDDGRGDEGPGDPRR